MGVGTDRKQLMGEIRKWDQNVVKRKQEMVHASDWKTRVWGRNWELG